MDYSKIEIQEKIKVLSDNIAIIQQNLKQPKSVEGYDKKIETLTNRLRSEQHAIYNWKALLSKHIMSEIRKEQDLLAKAAQVRVKRFKVLNPKVDLHGLHQRLVDGRLPIDISYFKNLVKVIYINGKATLVTKSLEQPVSWKGTTGNNVTITDRSVERKAIYQAHRIVYAINTGIDPVESDIGFKDGDRHNYAFSNLIYKG